MFSRIILGTLLTHLALCISAAYAKPIRYVAIGDSYTVATGIEEKDSWPSQLTQKLAASGLEIRLVKILGQRGLTSQQTINGKLPLLKDFKPDFVTLLIGVNDWLKDGASSKIFTLRIKDLIEGIQKVLSKPNKLLVLTIPDFSCSPQKSKWGYGKSAVNGISRLNRILKNEADFQGLLLVDIYPLSQKLCSQTGMFSDDGVHPSALQYSKWVNFIFPHSFKMLKNNSTNLKK